MTPITPTRTPTSHIGLFLALSLAINAIFLVVSVHMLVDDSDAPTPKAASEEMRVRVLSDSSLSEYTLKEADDAQEDPADEQPEPEKEKKTPDEQLPYVYDPNVYPEFEVPERADYSGRQAMKVDEQTVKRGTPGASQLASRADPNNRPNTPRRSIPNKGTVTEQDSVDGADEAPSDAVPKEEVINPREESSDASRRDEFEGATSETPDITFPSKVRKQQVAQGLEEESDEIPEVVRRGTPGGLEKIDPSEFFPNASNSEVVSTERGDGGTFNVLDDINEDDRTLINRKRNRYWTFWDRMTRQVRREWSPVSALRKRDPYGNVYGVDTFYTLLKITLNSDGSVRQLVVRRSSGLDFLDDEAVRAFNAAAPFPNPPEGLKDEDGLIHIRFAFVLESSSGDLKIFRARPKNPF